MHGYRTEIQAAQAEDPAAIRGALVALREQGSELRSLQVKVASRSIRGIAKITAAIAGELPTIAPGGMHTFFCVLMRLPAEKVVFSDGGYF